MSRAALACLLLAHALWSATGVRDRECEWGWGGRWRRECQGCDANPGARQRVAQACTNCIVDRIEAAGVASEELWSRYGDVTTVRARTRDTPMWLHVSCLSIYSSFPACGGPSA
eukprot:1501431-Rhodomonas_salina.3